MTLGGDGLDRVPRDVSAWCLELLNPLLMFLKIIFSGIYAISIFQHSYAYVLLYTDIITKTSLSSPVFVKI